MIEKRYLIVDPIDPLLRAELIPYVDKLQACYNEISITITGNNQSSIFFLSQSLMQ